MTEQEVVHLIQQRTDRTVENLKPVHLNISELQDIEKDEDVFYYGTMFINNASVVKTKYNDAASLDITNSSGSTPCYFDEIDEINGTDVQFIGYKAELKS